MKKLILSFVVVMNVVSLHSNNLDSNVSIEWNRYVKPIKNFTNQTLDPVNFSFYIKNIDKERRKEGNKQIIHNDPGESSSNSVFNFIIAKDRSQKTIVLWSSKISNEYDFFYIEKSLDGKKFQTIGIIEAVKFSQRIVEYSFVDIDANESKAFYRIRQEKRNGIKSYSEEIEFIDAGYITQK